VRGDQYLKMKTDPAFYYTELPYGWCKLDTPQGPRIGINEPEAAIIREIATHYLAGAALGTIAGELNAAGLRTRNGKLFSQTTCQWLLFRPLNAGIVEWGTKETFSAVGPPLRLTDKFPPLLDAETIARIDERRARRKWRSGEGRTMKSRFLLSGLARCGLCDGPLVGTHSGRHGELYYYFCQGWRQYKTCEARKGYRAEPLEASVLEHLRELIDGEAARAAVPPPAPGRDYAGEQVVLEARLAELESSITKHVALHVQGLIDATQLKMVADAERAERAELQEQIGQIRDAEAAAATADQRVTEWPERARRLLDGYDDLPREAAKAEIAALLERVIVWPDHTLRIVPRL
jgi:site-specific DNA recombinase